MEAFKNPLQNRRGYSENYTFVGNMFGPLQSVPIPIEISCRGLIKLSHNGGITARQIHS